MFRKKRKPEDFSAEIESHLQLELERLKEARVDPSIALRDE